MLRAIDANLNRLAEGLRVLEDIARFHLDDGNLTRQLREWRHRLVAGVDRARLLEARQADADVGAAHEEAEYRGGLADLVAANASRCQESLRVLEEMARLPEPVSGVEAATIKQARFALYTLEKELAQGLARRQRRDRVKGLYVILDPAFCGGRPEAEVAEAALRGGATMVQWRDKSRDKGEMLPPLRQVQEVCAAHNALLIVNDHVDLALAIGADGVHVGQKDLPVALARRLLPHDRLVGCSTALVEEAVAAQAQGADYIAVGSIYPTTSKEATRPAGVDTLKRVRQAISLPLVAIGGIKPENVAQVMAAGADAVAVITAVVAAPDVEAAARHLIERMRPED